MMGWSPKKAASTAFVGGNRSGAGYLGGSVLGPVGMVGGAILGANSAFNVKGTKNTPFDIKTWNHAGGLLPGGEKGASPGSSVGASLPTPELGAWKSLESKDIKQLYTPRQLDQQAIANDMQNSPWYKMALEKQGAEQNQLYNQAAQQAASANAQAQASLAARGGLRSGAAERLAASSGDNLALARQNVLGQGAIERGNLGMQSLDRSADMSKFNIGQLAQAEQGNIQAALQNNAAQNDQERMKYQEAMKLKAAGMTGDALSKGGGGKK